VILLYGEEWNTKYFQCGDIEFECLNCEEIITHRVIIRNNVILFVCLCCDREIEFVTETQYINLLNVHDTIKEEFEDVVDEHKDALEMLEDMADSVEKWADNMLRWSEIWKEYADPLIEHSKAMRGWLQSSRQYMFRVQQRIETVKNQKRCIWA